MQTFMLCHYWLLLKDAKWKPNLINDIIVVITAKGNLTSFDAVFPTRSTLHSTWRKDGIEMFLAVKPIDDASSVLDLWENTGKGVIRMRGQSLKGTPPKLFTSNRRWFMSVCLSVWCESVYVGGHVHVYNAILAVLSSLYVRLNMIPRRVTFVKGI